MNKIIFGSHNAGKYRDIKTQVPTSMNLAYLGDYDIPPIAETGLSFIENAILKARYACETTGHPAFADDSGLIVPTLDGQPGLYTARYAGPNASNTDNINKLLQAMQAFTGPERDAEFVCVIAFVHTPTDPRPRLFEGSWHGRITPQPQGSQGFGYDPVFFVPSHQCTAAELNLHEKQQLSHRGQAMRQLIQFLHQATASHASATN